MKFQSILLLIFLSILNFTACEVEETIDLNGASLDLIVNNAQLSDIQSLATGIESAMRIRLGTYYDVVSLIGREYYRVSNSDPRFTGDILGRGTSTIDNNTFYTTGPFGARYNVIKNCNITLEAINNTSAALSDIEKNSIRGFVQTIQAYSLLLVLNQQYNNGVRLDVADPDNLGDFVSLEASLTGIKSLLDASYALLQTSDADASFILDLSSGFVNFDDPALDAKVSDLAKFNRAIAARVALYQNDLPEVLDALTNSFIDFDGDLNTGVSHTFSTAGGDQLNPLFYAPNSNGETIIVHPDFIADTLAGDTRINKVSKRTATLTFDDLSSDYDLAVYASTSTPIPIIRNEELILIYAEANRTSNTAEAVRAINIVRNAANIGDYTGATSPEALLTEILFQRRYSLLGEGHRWIDARRHDLLNTLPIDREDDDVFIEFPRPATEN